jgi:hypothetical protein
MNLATGDHTTLPANHSPGLAVDLHYQTVVQDDPKLVAMLVALPAERLPWVHCQDLDG